MKLPFTTEQFFEVIKEYNLYMFPSQIILLILGMVCVYLLHTGLIARHKIIGSYLGLLWIWMGLAYHLAFFTSINKGAYLFGAIFILQGVMFLFNTFIKNKLEFAFAPSVKDFIAYFFIFVSDCKRL